MNVKLSLKSEIFSLSFVVYSNTLTTVTEVKY